MAVENGCICMCFVVWTNNFAGVNANGRFAELTSRYAEATAWPNTLPATQVYNPSSVAATFLILCVWGSPEDDAVWNEKKFESNIRHQVMRCVKRLSIHIWYQNLFNNFEPWHTLLSGQVT